MDGCEGGFSVLKMKVFHLFCKKYTKGPIPLLSYLFQSLAQSPVINMRRRVKVCNVLLVAMCSQIIFPNQTSQVWKIWYLKRLLAHPDSVEDHPWRNNISGNWFYKSTRKLRFCWILIDRWLIWFGSDYSQEQRAHHNICLYLCFGYSFSSWIFVASTKSLVMPSSTKTFAVCQPWMAFRWQACKGYWETVWVTFVQ